MTQPLHKLSTLAPVASTFLEQLGSIQNQFNQISVLGRDLLQPNPTDAAMDVKPVREVLSPRQITESDTAAAKETLAENAGQVFETPVAEKTAKLDKVVQSPEVLQQPLNGPLNQRREGVQTHVSQDMAIEEPFAFKPRETQQIWQTSFGDRLSPVSSNPVAQTALEQPSAAPTVETFGAVETQTRTDAPTPSPTFTQAPALEQQPLALDRTSAPFNTVTLNPQLNHYLNPEYGVSSSPWLRSQPQNDVQALHYTDALFGPKSSSPVGYGVSADNSVDFSTQTNASRPAVVVSSSAGIAYRGFLGGNPDGATAADVGAHAAAAAFAVQSGVAISADAAMAASYFSSGRLPENEKFHNVENRSNSPENHLQPRHEEGSRHHGRKEEWEEVMDRMDAAQQAQQQDQTIKQHAVQAHTQPAPLTHQHAA